MKLLLTLVAIVLFVKCGVAAAAPGAVSPEVGPNIGVPITLAIR